MSKYIVKATPDYLPLSSHEFVRHFSNLLTRETYNHWINYDNYTAIIGYSCRSLFEMIMEYFSRDDLVVATTPIHHTSFRNIIEKYVKPENIHIIELNKNYNEIDKIPEIEKCDLVIITHLFGQDMDLSKFSKFKEKHNCLIIEDRVQGGSLDLKFSNIIIDISLYSMAMDKRPIALGGGFMYVNNKHDKLIVDFKGIIKKLPREKLSRRFKDLLKKIPTYLLYNSRQFFFTFFCILKLLNFFNSKISILNITKSYRKGNPGFARGGYMVKPSQGLLKSMFENFNKHKQAEQLYTKKYEFFIENLSPKIVLDMFPWYKGNTSLTPYNTILVNEQLIDEFLEFLNDNNMSGLPNPTYKIFNHSYESDSRYKKFNNGIAYLPCIVNMSKDEIIYLTNKIKEFYITYKLNDKEK